MRELAEEVEALVADDPRHVGFVYEDESEVGRVHFGFVYAVETIKLAEKEDALANAEFTEPSRLVNLNLELWSTHVLRGLFGVG